MITEDDYDEDDGYEPEPDWDDDPDDDWREPDGDDYEIARAYEEHAEHCEAKHGGGECDCRPSLLQRASWRLAAAGRWVSDRRYRARAALRGPLTVRVGRAEFTFRLVREPQCMACSGRGWFYTMDRHRPDDRPAGYNGAALCGCGSAIASLADTRRTVRLMSKEAPF